MKNKDIWWLITALIIWRVALQIILWLAVYILFPQNNFLGGGIEEFSKDPFFWAWSNYDGEHYVYIARYGYTPLTQFYFPLYPYLMNLISSSNSLYDVTLSGILISHIFFVIAIFGFWKLLAIDYKINQIKKIIMLLLIFPTSYYFVAVYTESIFLAFIVWSFYFARKEKWGLAGFIGAFASATRIVGAVLFPAYLLSYITNAIKTKNKQLKIINVFKILLVLIGLLAYMYFLAKSFGDLFLFTKSTEIFGEYRGEFPLLLPQIFFRYFFRIVPNLSWSYLPVVFTTLLELFSGIALTLATLWGIKRLSPSYWLYMMGGFIMPTLSSGFVSLPRYLVVLFPFFILMMNFLENRKSIKIIYIILSVSSLGLALALFSHGYWVS